MTFAIVLLIVGAGVALYYIWRAEKARTAPTVDHTSRPPASRIVDHVVQPLTVDIVYGDADGIVTERSVTVLAVDYDQDRGAALKLEGWCHLREARRNFRVDRILEMTNCATGEPISSPARYLVGWAKREIARQGGRARF